MIEAETALRGLIAAIQRAPNQSADVTVSMSVALAAERALRQAAKSESK